MSNNMKHTIIYKEAQTIVMDEFDSTSFAEDDTYEVENEAIDYAEPTVDFAEDDVLELNDVLEFVEESESDGEAESVTVFKEDLDELKNVSLGDVLEPLTEGEGSLGDLGEDLRDLDKDVTKFVEEHGDMPVSDLLPGAEDYVHDEEEEPETDYKNDKDLSKFMNHVGELYPAQIPSHDGTSTVGCERAISFLDRLNGDISRAIREDHESVLDIAKLEDVRVNIMRDVLVLKDHMGKLKKQIKDSHSKKDSKASSIPSWKSPSGRSLSYKQLKDAEEMKKKAATPSNIVIAVSPFERAISGMMINAHVSAGHPMEDVYASLKKKYDLTDREELSIMQLCMDSGFHIFKDRGSYAPEESGDDDGKRGIDFVRNYFA